MLLHIIFVSCFAIVFQNVIRVTSFEIHEFNVSLLLPPKNENQVNVTIEEVSYGRVSEFICRVVAHPKPNIIWKDNRGLKLHSVETVLTVNNTISRITVDSRASNTYTCYVETSLKKVSKTVSVLTPFAVHESPKDITGVKYGTVANITCNVTSLFPLIWRWYREGDVKMEIPTWSTGKYVVSPFGTTLFITSMDFNSVGNYTCEASLRSHKHEKISFTTNVQITDRKAPKLRRRTLRVHVHNSQSDSDSIKNEVRPSLTKQEDITFKKLQAPIVSVSSNSTVVVKNGEQLSVSCSATGIPEPIITWLTYYENPDDEIIPEEGFILYNRHMDRTKSGLRKCIATNSVGTVSRAINVIV